MFYFLLRALFSVIFYSYDNVSSLLALCTVATWRIVPLPWGSPLSRPVLFTCCTLSPSLHYADPLILSPRANPSSSYLSQADVSENRDLQVWLLGNGSSAAPLLIGNLQSRERMVKVSNTSPSLVLRSANLPWQSGRQ